MDAEDGEAASKDSNPSGISGGMVACYWLCGLADDSASSGWNPNSPPFFPAVLTCRNSPWLGSWHRSRIPVENPPRVW